MKQPVSLAARCGAVFALSQLIMCAAWADDSAAIADLKAKLEVIQRDVNQLVESGSKGSADTGAPLHGFADVGFTRASNNDTRLDQAGRGFSAGSLGLYFTPQFGDRAKALVELIFEFAPDGGLETDLERIQLGYTFNDQLTAWMGRFHAPYGYWNTAFHHGMQIQTSVLRPRFNDFEDKGGLLPVHVMGAWATGHVGMGDGKLAYDLYTGNGNAIDATAIGNHDGTLAINNSRDSNGNTLIGANIGYNIGGLVVGVHGFSERVNIRDVATTTALGEVSVKMTGLYGVYEDDNWETIAEYYRFNNENLTGGAGSHSSWLAFAQVARTFGNDWTPYVRVEKASLNQNDPYFGRQQFGVSYTRQALGVRYNLNAKAALKFEANQTKEGDGTPATGPQNGSYGEGQVQYAIRF